MICFNMVQIFDISKSNSAIAADNEEQNKYISEEFSTFISPSGLISAEVQDYTSNTIEIHNLETEEISEIKIEDELNLTTSIESVQWIDNDKIAVIEHINPSLSYLCIYDIQENKVLEEKYGSDFTWNNDDYENMIYVKHTPHFAGNVEEEEILNFDDEVLYTTDLSTNIDSIAVSPDNKSVYWFANDRKEKNSSLVQGTLDSNSKIKSIKEKSWNNEEGTLSFENDYLVSTSSDFKYEISPSSLSIVKKDAVE